jgi:AcrR family transcriptional regulator
MSSPSENRPPPRKRPRQARSTETVDVIIEAGARILEAEGHGAFSTNAVAQKAGVSIGTLYQYFPNKEAIIGALLARETAQLVSSAEAALQRVSAVEALSDLISAAVEHQFKRPGLARVLDYEESRLPLDVATQSIVSRVGGVVTRILERLDIPENEVRQIAAQDVIAIIKGIIDAAGSNAEADPSAVTRRVRRAVFGYLYLKDPHI